MNRLSRVLVVIALCMSSLLHADEVTIDYKGRMLNGELVLAEGKGLDAPLVLMTHGTLGHNRMDIMTALQNQLTTAGFNTLAINLSLGVDNRHGMYECATPHRCTHREALDELAAWLEWLNSRGASRITLLGHSRGANQTAWFASEHDDPAIERVVLIAPMTWNKGDNAKEYRQRFGKELAPTLSRARQLVAKGKGDELLPDVGFISCANTSVSARAFADYYAHEPRFDTPLLLQKIAKPVLVVAGSADTTVPDVAKKVAPLAERENIRLVVIDGADHFFRDIYGERAAEAIGQFMQE